MVGIVALAILIAVASIGLGRTPPIPGGSGAAATPTPAPISTGSVATNGASPSPDATASPAATPGPGSIEPLGALLALLRIAPERRAGYDRSLFVHWIDADGDGCDTRREVLIAEAVVAPTVGPRCSLSGGRWLSLYDGLTFTATANVQIDHVVALAEAWDSGASGWSAARREAYANDLGEPWVLIAVSAASNQSKSDSDPADWLPPSPTAVCPFLSAWIAIKARWSLSIDQREHDALADEIGACPGSEMPFEPVDGAGQPTTGPTAGPKAGCDPAYPTVCIPPPPPDLDCGEITYRNFAVLAPDPHRFDGDHDGIGCET